MPSQKTQSGLLARLKKQGAAKAHEAAMDKPLPAGFIEVPAGIKNGVAQLWEMKFGVYTKEDFKDAEKGTDLIGKDYFSAYGIIQEPVEHNGIPCRGLRTYVNKIPLCNTPGKAKATFEEHYEDMLVVIRRFLGEGDDIGLEDLEDIAARLTEEQPYFRFRTWRGGKQEIIQDKGKWWVVTVDADTGSEITRVPRKGPFLNEAAAKASPAGTYAGTDPMTRHDWGMACEYTPTVSGTQDDTGGELAETVAPTRTPAPTRPAPRTPTSNGTARGATTTPPRRTVAVAPVAPPPAEKEEVFNEFAAGVDDLASLAESAQAAEDAGEDNSDAQNELRRLATEAGISEDDVDNAPSWSEVAAMIEAGAAQGGGEVATGTEDKTAVIPAKEDIWHYRPTGRSGRPAKEAAEVLITSVNKAKRTVICKNTATGIEYKDVSFDALED